MNERGREIIFHLLVHFPKAQTIWGPARPKVEARSSVHVCHAEGRAQALEHHLRPPRVLTGRKVESDEEYGIWELQGVLNHCAKCLPI